MSNPALSLSSDLILDLLGELSVILQERESAVISSFYNILYSHPVAQSARERSLLLPSPPSESLPAVALEMTIENPPVLNRTTGEQSSFASASDISAAPDHDGVAVGQTDVSVMQKNDSGGGVGGKGCCRNGAKRVVLRQNKTGSKGKKGKGKRDIQDVSEDSSGGTGEVNGPVKKARMDKGSQKDSDKEAEGHRIGGGKAMEKRGKKESPNWMVNGAPPPLEQRTTQLIDQLSQIDLNDGLQSLITLVNRLIQPVTVSEHPSYSLAAVIAECHERESNVVLENFNHMISLVRLAFYIER